MAGPNESELILNLKNIKIVSSSYMFIFFACTKKTNQKKRQPFTWPRSAGLPCAAQNNRAL